MLVPPVNFSLVVGQVYRSGHPIELNHAFLETLGLRTIVYVGDSAPEDLSAEYDEWVRERGITLVRLPMRSVKEPFVETDPVAVNSALALILDRRNHPVLVHSDKGKHRVGVVVAVVRKCLQQWSLAPIYEEYIRFARGKTDADFLFVEQFEPGELGVPSEEYPRWVHSTDDVRELRT